MKPFFQPPAARENKPSFAAIPEHILQKIARRVDGDVVGGDVVYGSFSASAGYVLELDSSLKIFAKGSHPEEMSHGAANIRQEIKTYEYVPVLKEIAPAFFSSVSDNDDNGWWLGLWEYVPAAENVSLDVYIPTLMQTLVKMHQAPVPDGVLPRAQEHIFLSQFFKDDKKWRRLKAEKETRAKFLTLFEDPSAGAVWFDASIDTLIKLQTEMSSRTFVEGLVHGDLRLDNLVLSRSGVKVIDWPNACIGPVLFDLVFLFSHLESQGFGTAEIFFEAYKRAGGTAFATSDTEELAVMAGGIAGYFADQAYRAVPEKLPRLRWMQKSLLMGHLLLLSRLGKIESPPRFSGQSDI